MRKLPPLSALRAFEATARHLSMKRAADELSVTPTAISHQIRRLEETLGVTLFERQVRALRLSKAGERLYPVLNTGFDAFAQAVDAIRAPEAQPARQRVTLTAPMGLAARWLVPRLGEFATQHPEVDLRIHASDTVVDLHGGSADLAVRYGESPAASAGLVAEHLFDDAYAPVCHPGLNIRSHDDLARVPLIHSEWQRTLPQPIGWPLWARAAGIEHVLKIESGIVLSDDGHAMSAAMAGQGVILANLPLVRDALDAGALVQPFEGPVIRRYAFWAVMPATRLEEGAVRAVWDWLHLAGSRGL
ncbi:LysR substrate-binding domain-containing protein [Ralstonia insidiosa]|jgi:LysR family glycine cleavage system transcriptional activator|uniref:LysR substrate-binding domain-containing protein n=1 Tax=Ralstonia TaxID=48736 RepID=UPI0009E43AE2|nr:LysR substrate-binding domain-containing protein [Ralstonia insidiosa]MBX3770663.1 LysR family transcriptional regulator [Ralstonia pickettii]NOZ19434.1 LysR family transcriptional regulator [Betaproteobacteria bacterium]MBA9854825.1 LysR family transcriptional regulator [Ralstonia insidiosa]MBA9868640.1 LysR family transcriptional regulator [Ralstonia insidiosa]MBA9911121.1 LysR family transcriptional regulator [Ralstonia insidiosa]